MLYTIKNAAPLFHQKTISKIFSQYDAQYLIRQLETILLPGSLITVKKRHADNIVEVVTKEYPFSLPLYTDARFLSEIRFSSFTQKFRKSRLPTRRQIEDKIDRLKPFLYIWGGNIPDGLPELLHYYPPKIYLTTFEYLYRQLKGCDCSGLLYFLTNGATPRNTQQIKETYPEVPDLKPLDLILYSRHVAIVKSCHSVIESRLPEGLVISDLKKYLQSIEHLQPQFLRFFS